MTIGEVKTFRDQLYRSLNKAFTQKVHFGAISVSPTDPYTGSYIRIDSGTDSAELVLTPLPDSYEGDVQYYVSGLAIWGADRPYGPNLGTIQFVGQMSDQQLIVYRRRENRGGQVVTTFSFSGSGDLTVMEENYIGEYGMNVTFAGTYKRAGWQLTS